MVFGVIDTNITNIIAPKNTTVCNTQLLYDIYKYMNMYYPPNFNSFLPKWKNQCQVKNFSKPNKYAP